MAKRKLPGKEERDPRKAAPEKKQADKRDSTSSKDFPEEKPPRKHRDPIYVEKSGPDDDVPIPVPGPEDDRKPACCVEIDGLFKCGLQWLPLLSRDSVCKATELRFVAKNCGSGKLKEVQWFAKKPGGVKVKGPKSEIWDYGEAGVIGWFDIYVEIETSEGLRCSAGFKFEAVEIEIISNGRERSFSPPLSETGEEIWEARFSGTGRQPKYTTIQWGIVPNSGTATVEFESPFELKTKVFARHPNHAEVEVLVVCGAAVQCRDAKEISVPQFFWLRFDPGFDDALRYIGLRRSSPSSTAETALNRAVRNAVIEEIQATARLIYQDVNVRFTLNSPASAVGSGNFSTIDFLDQDSRNERYGATNPPPAGAPNAGVLDEENRHAACGSGVFSGEFTSSRSGFFMDPIYTAIFEAIAIHDPEDRSDLFGTPVAVGEFPTPAIPSVRQLQIRAAIRAFGRLNGATAAHEAGHALGLVPEGIDGHNGGNGGFIMDAGQHHTFTEKTGISAYNFSTGALTIGAPHNFNAFNAVYLTDLLPILP